MPLPKPSSAVASASAGLLLLGLGTAALAQGTPRSVGECERLKNDLAYNQCLAMFGPAAKNVAGGYASGETPPVPALPATAAASLADEPAEEARGSRRGRYRVRRGRQSAVFTAGGSEGRSYRHRRRRR